MRLTWRGRTGFGGVLGLGLGSSWSGETQDFEKCRPPEGESYHLQTTFPEGRGGDRQEVTNQEQGRELVVCIATHGDFLLLLLKGCRGGVSSAMDRHIAEGCEGINALSQATAGRSLEAPSQGLHSAAKPQLGLHGKRVDLLDRSRLQRHEQKKLL